MASASSFQFTGVQGGKSATITAAWASYSSGTNKYTGVTSANSSGFYYRFCLRFTVTPGANQKITSITLPVKVSASSSSNYGSTNTTLYLYTPSSDIFTNASCKTQPDGYIASAASGAWTSKSTLTNQTFNYTFSGLNITSATTIYIWYATTRLVQVATTTSSISFTEVANTSPPTIHRSTIVSNEANGYYVYTYVTAASGTTIARVQFPT